MSKDLDNAFLDVRNGFRLLFQYQTRVLQIIKYIREHTPYTSMWGRRLFCNTIHTTRNSPDSEYANLAIPSNMWAWDFMYNYLFEFYFGVKKIGGQNVDMSVVQVSDDGYFKSAYHKPTRINPTTFMSSEDSNSWFIISAGTKAWFRDYEENDCDKFLHKFIASQSDTNVYKDEDGAWFVSKKYRMQQFASQIETDKIIADFGKLVSETGGVTLFK